jgi:hypothetical protein
MLRYVESAKIRTKSENTRVRVSSPMIRAGSPSEDIFNKSDKKSDQKSTYKLAVAAGVSDAAAVEIFEPGLD